MRKSLTSLVSALIAALLCAGLSTGRLPARDDPWTVLEGKDGPGKGKHIVLVSGDEEYRSEEALAQLGKILAKHHGFKCTVLFAVNPEDGTIDPLRRDNIPGLEALETADLMAIFTRFRDLPDGFGRQVLGETWINHHGHHGKESTRGVPADGMEGHPILRGTEDIWGPTDVYGVRLPLPGDSKPLVMGQVLEGMKPTDKPVEGKKNDPMMPLAWTKTYETKSGKKARVFSTTMGSSQDLSSEGFRRLLVNACYWAVGLEDRIPEKANVDIVGEYDPLPFGFGGFKKGLKPSDHKL